MNFDLPNQEPKQAPSSGASPIADLSYRNYEGELKARSLRWWVISMAVMRLLKKNVGFWITVGVIVLIYFFAGLQLYLTGSFGNQINGLLGIDDKTKYASSFFQVFGNTGLMVFILCLTVGAGSIAADNKANALMVYLSKPLTKGDYLLGKWAGIFMTLFLVNFLPAFTLYLYCLTSYLSQGFLKNDPLLILKIVGACLVPSIIHASLLVGCSAWSKSPRAAYIFYAGLYFLSSIASGIVFGILYRGDFEKGGQVLNYSLSGVINGMSQSIFGVHVTMGSTKLPIPSAPLMLTLSIVLVVLGIGAARAKINAVEVVKG